MHRLLFVILSCLAAGCGATRAADKANDTARWQGTWKLVSATSNGQTETANLKWIVSGDHYNICINGNTGSDPYMIKLDPSKKQIDVFHHDTPKGTYGGSYKGIYEIKGDSLKVCYDGKGQRYPQSFDAGPGSGQLLYQFQREQR
jgi:uncharacterized protein (TIGR03067 family)